jgi:hypothetical protein
MRKYLLILLLALMNCGIDSDLTNQPKRWNLSEYIYVNNQLDISSEKNAILFIGMKGAISNAGGLVVDFPVSQVLTIRSTNEQNCARPMIRAFTHFPTNGIIYFCTDFALSMPYTVRIATNTAMHELFHELSNRDDHLDCTAERPIMAANASCSQDRVDYTELDKKYCGAKGYTIGGECKK